MVTWGFFNKVKKGLKKLGSAFKKGLTYVNDKIVQPFKPVIKSLANRFLPGAGAVVDVASNALNAVTKGDYRGAYDSGKEIINWASDTYRKNKS